MKDIIKTVQAVRGKGIELLITCGNAGDVRKGLVAANLLKIPTLHIEQDIYNPIEMIAFANLVTTPSQQYIYLTISKCWSKQSGLDSCLSDLATANQFSR